jgi:uncharacterized protein (DUF3820 family)
MFNNEFDMLDIRLAVTEHYVDRWIVLEGSQTWSGHKKPYHLSDNLHRYHGYQDRMSVIKLDIPEEYLNWQCENHSRAGLQQGIDLLDDQDVIMHSDLDEILNPEKIKEILDLMDQPKHYQKTLSEILQRNLQQPKALLLLEQMTWQISSRHFLLLNYGLMKQPFSQNLPTLEMLH